MRLQTAVFAVMMGVLFSACGGPLVGEVEDATYHALVPTAEQLATDAAKDLSGGFAVLRDSGVDEIEVVVEADEITIRIDGAEAITRSVIERLSVQDSEGSGPFKGEKEILVLGVEPLMIGDLTITDPVVWPGSFEDSPVITIKSYDEGDKGPGVSCDISELCLLLTSGVDPVGGYEDANNPELDENPVATITVSDDSIEFMLDSGETAKISRSSEFTSSACGLSETAAWEVPISVGVEMEEPVLVHTACPSTPGDNYLIIIDRSDLPLLAPLGPEFAGEWCQPGSDCLLFVPTG